MTIHIRSLPIARCSSHGVITAAVAAILGFALSSSFASAQSFTLLYAFTIGTQGAARQPG